MGRHKDPDTLSFIDRLAEKGEELGFVVESEYALLKDEYFVDLVWKLRKDQDPLVTFEIETKDSARVFSNTAKIFDTSSKLVTKPWRHFMIIYKSKLSQGHKDSLFLPINQHNVFLFENVCYDTEEKRKLEATLDSLKYDLSVLIERLVATKPLATSIPIITKGLTNGLGEGYIEKPEVSISIKSRSPQERGLKGKIVIVTKKGELTFLDKLKEAQKTGTPFSIETPQLKDFVLGEKSILPTEKGKAKLTVMPQLTIKPVKIVIPETSISFEEILLRLIKQEQGVDYLSTEERNLPFVFELAIDKQKESGKYSFRFEKSVGDVRQYLLFEEFVKALTSKKDFQIIDPKENKLIIGFRVKEEIKQDPHWYDLIVKLAYIQEKTNHKIPAPSRITKEDITAIYSILGIINTGEEIATIKEISVGVDKKTAKTFIDMLEKEGKIYNMGVSQSLTYRKLFNEEISLGPSKVKLPDMKIKESIAKVKEQIKVGQEGATIDLTLVPIKENRVTVKFENWLN